VIAVRTGDTFTHCAASDVGSLDGGAVQNLGGFVQINGCNFLFDTADASQGAGGAIDNTGTMSIASSAFYYDSANFGGAIFSAGNLLVSNSVFGQCRRWSGPPCPCRLHWPSRLPWQSR